MKCIGRGLEVQEMQKTGLLPIFGFRSRQRILCRDRDFWFHVATMGVVSRQDLALGSEFSVAIELAVTKNFVAHDRAGV